MKEKIASLCLLLVWLATVLPAQTWTGDQSVAVQVNDSKGRAVADARVVFTFQGIPGETGPDVVATDGKGRAVLASLAPGPWQIEISHSDYLSFIAMVDVRRGKKPLVSASFLEAGGRSLSPVKVKFSKGDRQQASPVLEARRPTESPAPTAPAPQEQEAAASAPEPAATEPEPEQPTSPELVPDMAATAADTAPVPAPTAPEPEIAATVAVEAPTPEPQTPEPERSAARMATPEPAPESVAVETIPAVPEPVEEKAPRADVEARVEEEPKPAPEPAVIEPIGEEVAPPPVAAPPVVTPPPPAPEPEPIPEVVEAEIEDDPGPEPEAEVPAPSQPAASDPPALEVPVEAPQPPPVAAPPVAAVTAIAPPPDPGARVTSHRDGSCSDCESAEWTLEVSVAAPAVDPAAAGSCGRDVLEAARIAMQSLSTSIQLELDGFLGPVANGTSQEAVRRVEPDLSAPFAGELAAYLGGESPCQIVGLVLPKAVRFSRVALGAADKEESGGCPPGQTCAIGDAVWLGSVLVERGPSATVVYGLFENRSAERGRRAILTAYYRPPNANWQPRLPAAD